MSPFSVHSHNRASHVCEKTTRYEPDDASREGVGRGCIGTLFADRDVMHARLCVPWLLAATFVATACGDSLSSVPPKSSPSPTPTSTPTPEPTARGVFVYVANPDAKTVSGFSVGRSTGALTPLASSPTTLPGKPVALAIDGQARFAHVGLRGSPDALATYSIDGQTGALTAVPSSGLASPRFSLEPGYSSCSAEHPILSSIVAHPSGRFVYVTFDGDECICGVDAWILTYAVDSATGRLTQLDLPSRGVGKAGHGDVRPFGSSAVSVVSGPYLYATNRGVSRGGAEACDVSSLLAGFSVDPGSGELRRLGGTPFAEGSPNGGDGHLRLALKPQGDFLYLARQHDTVQFKPDSATGTLAQRGSSPLIGPAAFSPAGRLYSAASSGGVSGLQVFEIQPGNGSLLPKPDAFSATQGAVSAIAIDSSGRFLYAVQSESGVVSAFAIDAATGRLQPGVPTVVGTESVTSPDFRVIAIANVP